MELVGNTLGKYQIQAKVGELAGMVELYKAYDPMRKQEVQIKVLLPSRAKDDEFVQRFRLEAHTLAQLTHPNIVSVPAQWNNEPLYIVIEPITENSLADLIKQEAPLDSQRVIRFLKKIASGLDYAHTRSVIHQDLRPANILLDEQGAQINNFKLFQDNDHSQSISQRLQGILAYVAPEIIKNQAVTPQTDIYALGIIAYEMISGKVPFEGKNSDVFEGHLNLPPPSLHKLNPRVPRAVDQVISKALAKTPSERYLSASAFVHALRQALESSEVSPSAVRLPLGASPSSFGGASSRRVRRSRFAWDKVGMVFVILLSCEIIRLSIMQILITPVTLTEAVTPIQVPTVISVIDSTPTREASPIATLEPSPTVIEEPVVPVEPTTTSEPSATVTPKPSATETAQPSATATAQPSATATAEPSATATEEPSPTATIEPSPTATEEPLPTPTEVVGPPRAAIIDFKVNHGVPRNGQNGIEFLIDLTAENLQGVNCQLAVHFYDSLGNILLDQNNRYATDQGQVFVADFFVPDSNFTEYTEFELFIPYSELDLPPGSYELQSDIQLLYAPEFTLLAQRQFYQFNAIVE